MPPSKCCRLLRLPCTLTTALETTAPFRGAVIAQPPKPPKKRMRITQPQIAYFLKESSGGALSGMAGSAEGADAGAGVAGSDSPPPGTRSLTLSLIISILSPNAQH